MKKSAKETYSNNDAGFSRGGALDCHLRFKSEPFLRDLRLKSEHPLEGLVFKDLGIDQLVLVPESEFGNLRVQGINPNRDGLAGREAVDLQLQVVNRDFAVSVRGAFKTETEEIFGRFKRRRDFEFPEEALFFFEGLLKSKKGNLSGRGVDSFVIVLADFVFEDLAGLVNGGDILPDTGPDQMILKPAVGSFHFAFSLRRKGINDFDAAVLEDLSPLGIDFVRQLVVPVMELVSAADKTKDRMGIHVIRVRIPVPEHQGLQGLDVGPDPFFSQEGGIEKVAAVIIQRGNQVPFLLARGRPQVMRRIMLDEFSDVTGQDLPIVDFRLPDFEVEIILLGPVNDGGQGDSLLIFFFKPLFDVAIVVRVERDVSVEDRLFVEGQLFEDTGLNRRINPGGGAAAVLNRESGGIPAVFSQETKKSGL